MPELPAFGLALGGGALRGAAHVGVLEVLEEQHLRPTHVAGTSIGSIVGAAHAAGVGTGKMLELFSRLNWNALVRPNWRLKRALLDNSKLEGLLRDDLGLSTFEALEIPFAAVTTDLRKGEPVVITEGDLVEALLASSAIPGIFPPLERGEALLCDGGILENLPTRVVREMGADLVVGVDLLPKGEGPVEVDGLLEIWQRSLDLLILSNHDQHGSADVTIVPDIHGTSFSSFSEVTLLATRGREAALAALDAIRSGPANANRHVPGE
ncbi:MAG: patatin-like phospholipase family protein [bacterium]|nr:patatin-like phospholipase family protein [bacterium]